MESIDDREGQAIRAEIATLWNRLRELQRRIDAPLTAEDKLPPDPLWLLGCRVANERAALLLETVERVVPMALLSALPESPPWVAGILDLGGHSIAVLDVAARLSCREGPPSVDDVIVVCTVGGRRLGLLVQEVVDVFASTSQAVIEAGADVPHARYVLGVLKQAQVVHLLISVPRLVALSELTEGAPC